MNKEQLNLETIAKSTYLIGEFDAYSGVYTMKNSSNVLMFHVFPLCDEPIAIKSQRDNLFLKTRPVSFLAKPPISIYNRKQIIYTRWDLSP